MKKNLKLSFAKGNQVERNDQGVVKIVMPADTGRHKETQDKQPIKEPIDMIALQNAHNFRSQSQDLLQPDWYTRPPKQSLSFKQTSFQGQVQKAAYSSFA